VKHLILVCLLVCSANLLTACGNKGPLYLPEQSEQSKAAKAEVKTPQKQQIEKKQ
jgi:predicted small lipoprotein YifL